jgi:hypothetical protein
MHRGRTCRFLRHGRSIWRCDDVAKLAPSARSGSDIYSRQMNNLNRISTRHQYAPNPSTDLDGTKTQSHTINIPSVFSSVTTESANVFQSV